MKIKYYIVTLAAVLSFIILTFFTMIVRVDFIFMEEITLIVGGLFGVILIFIVGDKHNEYTKK